MKGNMMKTKKKVCGCFPPPHCRELKKRKEKILFILFHLHLAENSKEGGRSSCFMFGLEEDQEEVWPYLYLDQGMFEVVP